MNSSTRIIKYPYGLTLNNSSESVPINIKLGTDTVSTQFGVQNKSGDTLFSIHGDGSMCLGIVDTELGKSDQYVAWTVDDDVGELTISGTEDNYALNITEGDAYVAGDISVDGDITAGTMSWNNVSKKLSIEGDTNENALHISAGNVQVDDDATVSGSLTIEGNLNLGNEVTLQVANKANGIGTSKFRYKVDDYSADNSVGGVSITEHDNSNKLIWSSAEIGEDINVHAKYNIIVLYDRLGSHSRYVRNGSLFVCRNGAASLATLGGIMSSVCLDDLPVAITMTTDYSDNKINFYISLDSPVATDKMFITITTEFSYLAKT